MSGYPMSHHGDPGVSIDTEMDAVKTLAILQDRVSMMTAMARVLGDVEDSTDEAVAALGIATIGDYVYERLNELQDAVRRFVNLPPTGFNDSREEETRQRFIAAHNEHMKAVKKENAAKSRATKAARS